MSEKKKIFLVMAYRYSCTEGHIYPVGAYYSKDSAIHNAKKEAAFRGGKYGIKIFETRHPNHHKPERFNLIFEIESPYKDKLKPLNQTQQAAEIESLKKEIVELKEINEGLRLSRNEYREAWENRYGKTT